MTVVDASVLVELVLRTPAADAAAERLFRADVRLHAPHLVDLEVTSALRRLVLAGRLPAEDAHGALAFHLGLPIRRHGSRPWLPAILSRREHLTAYDAAYVVLAEILDAPLVTFDASLAAAPGHGARVEVLQRG